MRQTNTPRGGLRAFARHCIGLAALALAALAGAAQAQLPSPVFRFYNTQTGTHFYTINVAERDFVLVETDIRNVTRTASESLASFKESLEEMQRQRDAKSWTYGPAPRKSN